MKIRRDLVQKQIYYKSSWHFNKHTPLIWNNTRSAGCKKQYAHLLIGLLLQLHSQCILVMNYFCAASTVKTSDLCGETMFDLVSLERFSESMPFPHLSFLHWRCITCLNNKSEHTSCKNIYSSTNNYVTPKKARADLTGFRHFQLTLYFTEMSTGS